MRYFNENTGDEVQLDGQSARLDSLANWKRVEDGELLPEVVGDGVLSRPSLGGARPSRAPGQVLVETAPPAPEDVPTQETPPVELTPVTSPVADDVKEPAKNASKADWLAYTRTRTQTSEEEAEIEALSRDELAARYGGSS
ncbi:hypothetical protein GCM10011583_11970 [Streptomyces camponoticapitis]|uniref:Uncharacterized protein n=1 Tax=Streptomyces camponoticapitis TaxID=1616125 RepID=A0ABQ2DZH3_9ACTN|nr:hypothetical protein [Streptomyces camponoticapitis]GGJ82042.1 hypothetical protein GCM10011583_11970 [Streptomyces camponoticapitis]